MTNFKRGSKYCRIQNREPIILVCARDVPAPLLTAFAAAGKDIGEGLPSGLDREGLAPERRHRDVEKARISRDAVHRTALAVDAGSSEERRRSVARECERVAEVAALNYE